MSGSTNPRVLHILGELRPSGAEVMLRIAAPMWFSEPRRHAILATGNEEGPYADALRSAGYEVFHIRFQKRLAFFNEVRRLMTGRRFDAVHIHTERAHVFYGMAARAAGIRVVVRTIHNNFPFTGSLRLARMGMRCGLRWLGATSVAVGPSVAENERRVLRNPVSVIPNWYDAAVFRPPTPEERAAARRRFGLDSDRRVIVTLGNCNSWKNHPLLIRALPHLLAKDQQWTYLHAGGEDTKQSERALAADLGVLTNCSFIGYTNDPRAILWAADVYVMPSLREGSSIAAIEAAGCGLPVVLTDVPGLNDLKTVLPDGFWTPLSEVALARAIDSAYHGRASGGGANAAAARTAFSAQSGAAAYFRLYGGKAAGDCSATISEGN